MPTEAKERRKTYLERKESGCCPRCGIKMKKSSKFTYCEDCRSFFRDYNKDNSENINNTRKALYEERKENGCCPRCGKKLGKKYKKTICSECLEKQYEYNNRKNKASKKKSVKAKTAYNKQ